MRVPAIGRIFGTALRAWWDDDAPRLGASLAYYTLFAIAPILIVATAVAGMAFGAEAVRGEIIDQLDQLIGRDGASAVQSLLEGASQRRTGMRPCTARLSARMVLRCCKRARPSSLNRAKRSGCCISCQIVLP